MLQVNECEEPNSDQLRQGLKNIILVGAAAQVGCSLFESKVIFNVPKSSLVSYVLRYSFTVSSVAERIYILRTYNAMHLVKNRMWTMKATASSRAFFATMTAGSVIFKMMLFQSEKRVSLLTKRHTGCAPLDVSRDQRTVWERQRVPVMPLRFYGGMIRNSTSLTSENICSLPDHRVPCSKMSSEACIPDPICISRSSPQPPGQPFLHVSYAPIGIGHVLEMISRPTMLLLETIHGNTEISTVASGEEKRAFNSLCNDVVRDKNINSLLLPIATILSSYSFHSSSIPVIPYFRAL